MGFTFLAYLRLDRFILSPSDAYVSPLGDTENLRVTTPRQIKTPITPWPLEQIQQNFNG